MAEFFDVSLHLPTWLAYLLAGLIHCALIIGLVAAGALFFIWLERKVSGRIQDRLGPTRTGGRFGWLQSLADGIKLLNKEDVAPGAADVLLFRLAPYVSFAASYAAFLALPFANGWVARHVHTGIFFILAVLSLEVFGVILAGYSSGSKWSLFGAMREAAQVVSYEVPLKLCVIVPVLLCGTLDLNTISNMQGGWFTNWLVFHDPFTFVAFWVYFTCSVASVNRAPFDLAEAESELVAGFHTEYSGLRWSFFFMAEYGSMFLVSGLCAILFLGGWHGPIPLFDLLGWSYGEGETAFRLTGYLANLAGCVNLIFKGVVGVTVMIWVRWTLPRLRIDQVMTTCLKYCVPLAAFCFVGALAWQLLGLPGLNDLIPVTPSGPGGVRESWVLEAEAAERLAGAESTAVVVPPLTGKAEG
ncbi:MAG: NADH-quinone oxidoreductase subunit H [Pirellulaceae bacterium]|nr:NADH-quinone oxidoreductase subunit H [Pirellulaceae bacterium]MCU0981192.1 NADH-quinone oxidoreductase subunit H [Pirellulaceae bacterium]